MPRDLGYTFGLYDRTGKREKHPIAQFTHVFVRQHPICFMGAVPLLTSLVVVAGFTVVVVGASRNQVTELVNDFQSDYPGPNHQHHLRS